MPTYSKQNINIGIQSNDGTGDSIREAFRKTNENFQILFNYIGAGDGLTFFGSLQDTPAAGIGQRIIVTDAGGTTLTQVSLAGGEGISIDYEYENERWVVNNTTSTLSTDPSPALSANLDGNQFRAKDFGAPIADTDLVTRKYLFDNFLQRDGTYISGNESSTTTNLSSSTLRENISISPNTQTVYVTSGTNVGKVITVVDSTGSFVTVDLTKQATSSTHLTRKDYVDTKISLQGTDTIDPKTGEVNPGFGKMTGPLILSRSPQTSDDTDYNGLIAATKGYVDFNDFYSENNLFITQKGRDYQPEVPPIRRGRAQAYAFASINKAAQYAEQLIKTSRIIVGDYARLITYNNGTPAKVFDVVDDYYGNNLGRLRLEVGSLGSDQFGAANVGEFTIFPGQYIEGVDSKAIAMIENIAKGENEGDPEIYSIAYVDYGDDFNTKIVSSLVPEYNFNKNIIRFTFKDEPQQIVPIPEFWKGYQFYIDGAGQGTIINIGSSVDNRGVYHNYFDVEYTTSAPGGDIEYSSSEWHVYSGDFIPGETVVYNTNVSSLQITLVVESGEYYEQYPIKLAANVSIRGDEFRRCIIRPAPGPSASKWANTYFRRDAQIDGLQTSELDYNTDYADDDNLTAASVIPSGSSGVISVAIRNGTFTATNVGYIFVANGGQGIIETASEGGFTVNLGAPMLNAGEIPHGDWHIYRPITFGYHYLRDTQRPMNLLTDDINIPKPGGLEGAASLLAKNRAFFQEEIIAYIDQTFGTTGSFTYDQDKCYRDTGLIVDAVAQDLLFTTSSQSTFAGLQYWNQTSTEEIIPGQLTTTTDTISYIKFLALKVILNDTSGSRYSTGTQITSTASGTVSEAQIIQTDFEVITDILTNGTTGITDQIVPNNLYASTTASVVDSYNLLQANKKYLQDEAIAYIEATKTTGYVYNTAATYNTLGSIIDSVSFDLLYSGNRQATQVGVYFYGFSETSSAIDGQSVQTRAAYTRIRSILPDIIKGIAVGTTYQSTVTQVISTGTVGTTAEGTQAQSKIDVITKIINQGPDAAEIFGSIPLTPSTNNNIVNAANLIQANRQFIQAETIAYVDAQLSGFIYDKDICKRDVGLIIDSLANDLIYGGSERTIYAGDSYRDVAAVQETETIQTAAAITYLNVLAQDIILNTTATSLTTATQVFDQSIDITTTEPTAGLIIADLTQALSRIILNDAEYNPPKNNDQLDVFLMNDANVIRYVSCQNHGGFMQVLDPEGQIKNKSPYTQTASSFSQSINKQAFRGGMLVDGFAGNVECTPVEWDPVSSPLALDVTGLIRRPQVPTFFMNRGVRYEVDFFANFRQDGVNEHGVPLYAATLRLNPLTPGGISNTITLLDTEGGFKPNLTNIPIIVEQPTGIGGLAARGHAVSDSAGFIYSDGIVIDFPGTGYKETPFISVGGAILNNLTIEAGGVTNASIVSGGYGYATGCRIEIIPVGIIGGVKAVGVVTEVDENGSILAFNINNPGANWTSSVNYRVSFGNINILVQPPQAGFIDQQPEKVELITAGNRSMLANDFTQVNDLGYGIFVTNGGFMENVSMFTYYCYRSYYSLNGSQVRTLTGSSCYGEYGLVADGADPNEVPLSLSNVFPMVQIASCYKGESGSNPLFPAQAGQTYIFVKINTTSGGYPPLNGSLLEINHRGIRKQYSVGSASPALDSNNEPIFGVYQLFFNTGNIAAGTEGTGLLEAVNHNDPVIIRASTLVKISGFNPLSIARPSTSLTWNDNPTYVYHITGFSTVQPDGSVFAYTQEDYNYIVFQAVEQGVIHPTLVNGGSGYTVTGTSVTVVTSANLITSVSHEVDGTQGLGTIGIQTIKLDSVEDIKVGHVVSTGTYILPSTYVTWIDVPTKQICINTPTAGPITSGTVLTFNAVLPQAHAVISSGTISSIVIDNGGSGWKSIATDVIINGDGIDAGVANPVPIAGVAGSRYLKITTLELTSQNRIQAGLSSNPPKYFQFAHGDEIYNIVGYSTPSSRGAVFEVAITNGVYTSVAVTEGGSGYSNFQTLTLLGSQLGGESPENDLTLTVIQRNSSGGIIAVSFTGTAVSGTANFTDVSPPDDGQLAAEIILDKPLAEPISQGTILRAGIPVNSPGQLTTKISILRATSHDFVDIGTGGYATTRIPNDLYGPPIKQRNPSNEVLQLNRGRVYYVTSDQDGNFRVGNALTVNQAQGSVTISVPLDLSNLSALSLRRDLGPPVNEFSIDSTMITEADYKVPTEQAVANYINRRLGLDRNGNIYPGSPLGPQFLSLDGQLAMKADLNMGYTHRIINMQTPANNSDASTKGYTDTKISNAGTAALDVNGQTLKPEWGNMTGALQLYNDPDFKVAVLATTATVDSTNLKFVSLTSSLHQPGDFYLHRVLVDGVPTGTVVNSVFQDSVSLGLGNPETDQNVGVTKTIPAGTIVYFDPVKQAATKRYVDKFNQFSKLNDVELTNLEDTDIPMFADVMPVNTTSNTPLYDSTRKLINVANNMDTITNTPSERSGGSDITILRADNIATFKLRGGVGSNNPITDYHVNDDAEIQQSKLLMNTSTTRVSPATGTARQIQATLGLSNFDSQMFTATNGWVTLLNASTTTNGILTNKMSWIPRGGGLLGSTNTTVSSSASYITSSSVKVWLGDETSPWSFSSDLVPRTDNSFNLGSSARRWRVLFTNTLTVDGGLITNSNAQISTNQTVANVYTTTVTTGNLFLAGTAVNIGATTGSLKVNNPAIIGSQTTQDVFNTVATTVNAFGAATSINVGNATGATFTLRPGTLVGSNTSQNVFNTVATTVYAFGAATSINVGAANGTTTLRSSTLVGDGTTQNVFNTVATTVNAFGAATQLNLGNATGITTIAGNLAAKDITDNGNRVITSVDWTAGNGISITSEVTSGPSAAATINNTGVLSLAVSGTGLSINASTGALTVSSNATSANTGGTIVARDGSGNFNAGTISASAFSGGTFSGSSASLTGSLTVSSGNSTGGGIILANDGDIVDMNTGYCAMRFSSGVQIYNANKGGSAVITLATDGVMYGTASSARYADLAEKYQADAEYEPGTVLMFGGDAEVTLATIDGTRKVAGVVSTDPAYLMNSKLEGTNTVAVALTGRVPCKVKGKVQKGDMMVATENGFARAEENPTLGSVIGKALENFDGVEGVIEVVVGRI